MYTPPAPRKYPVDDGYITYGKDDEPSRLKAMAEYSKSVSDFDPPLSARGGLSYDRDFRHIDSNVSARTGFTRSDYEYFRPDEATPKRTREVISYCMQAYRKVGLIKNVIDLMGDFTCQGIKLVHPNAQIQRFHQQWFQRINGKDRSERFANTLYRCGTTVVKRSMAKLKTKDIEDFKRTFAEADIDLEKMFDTSRNEIPMKYTFLNPLSLEILSEELSLFVGSYRYGLILPGKLLSKIKNPKTALEKDLVNKIPTDILMSMQQSNARSIPLDPTRVDTYFYKKDDWELWGRPIIEAILDDLMVLAKTKLADLAALDGVISQVRLWRLGSLEHKIFPKAGGIAKVANILFGNVGGGSIDMVWGPELDFKESSSNAYRFLGAQKYEAVYNAIYQGLGVPPTLTGTSSASGFTNNFISLKTLIERLNYGRDVLTQFWNKELAIIQKAMGFRFPATVQFDRMVLTDEGQEKALLIQLADRGIIDLETILDRFDENPELVRTRLIKDQKARESGKLPRKAGPWNKPEFKEDILKLLIQNGDITPGEAGIELEEKEPDEQRGREFMAEVEKTKIAEKNKGIPQQGRPMTSKDKSKRKPKTVKPRTGASVTSTLMWAKEAQSKISEIMTPRLLQAYGRKNMRSLTKEQANEAEKVKFCVLSSVSPFTEVTEDLVGKIVYAGLNVSPLLDKRYKEMVNLFIQKASREPTFDELREIQVLAYSLTKAS